ncbi:putative lipid II flippase MurJ [Ktedonobacter sp. SOSP1-85]|uniref:murein biosynthesis integral membrane protein MurJ n=1 Tax=Ktedonobacter sp. SOSP1-85 TaxID=2778367 RepID=UPI0019162D85|nr:lipid II flippase MurJ [Ktedonobacter sp. SOSP1-85]GHO80917.1 putative lipid II flippase MurJ [Ktedonobacter sp. SOSP1-85]
MEEQASIAHVPAPEPVQQEIADQEIIEVVEVNETAPTPSKRGQLVKSATVVMLGNLGSSVLGQLRQSVLAGLGTAVTGPFATALTPLQTFLDLLANGTVSGALIPTFTDYADEESHQELRRVVYSLVNLLILISLFVNALFIFVAPWFVGSILAGDFTAGEKTLTITFSQVIICALTIMGPFAVLQAVLYARKEFGFAAFASGALHLGIIAGAIVTGWLGATHFGQLGLAFGVILGGLAQVVLLVPGLKRQRLPYMFVLDVKHPAIRRIFKLYAPLAVSYIVSMFFVFLDLSLMTRTPGDHAANLTAAKFATALIQFPGGLVAAALSFAILPTLSRYATENEDNQFKETLTMGLRLGLLLMIPAMAGLIILRYPIVSLLFHHGLFKPSDADLAAVALQNYAYQLPFLVVDQLIMFAFYARKNTIVPVIVGFVCYGLYALVALPFYRTIGMPALVFANTVQNSMHGILLFALFYKFFGSLHFRSSLPALLKIIIATVVMGVVAWALQYWMGHYDFFSLHTLRGQLLTTLIAGGAAVIVFFGGILLMKVEEISLLKQAVLAKLGKK